MERLIYREEQSMRQSFIPWIMLLSVVVMMGGFGVALYQQLYLGNPSSDGTSDQELIWVSIISFAFMSAVFIFILNRNLITEVWTDGVRYRFAPFVRKMKHIPLSEIASVTVSKYNPLTEFGGWGVRKRLFSRKTAYNISGRIGMRVILKNGRQVLFGTRQQEEMSRAVEKMLQPGKDKFAM